MAYVFGANWYTFLSAEAWYTSQLRLPDAQALRCLIHRYQVVESDTLEVFDLSICRVTAVFR